MNTKARSTRDAFTFSLACLSAKSSFVVMPIIADDRIQKAVNQESKQSPEPEPGTDRQTTPYWGRFWLRALRRPT